VGGGAGQLDRIQDSQKIVAVALQGREVQLRGGRRQQFLGNPRVPRTQLRDLAVVGLILALGERHQAQQRIGHAAARRQHHPEPSSRSRVENGRDLAEAVGVGDARPPELVHDPGSGVEHRSRISRTTRKPVRLY